MGFPPSLVNTCNQLHRSVDCLNKTNKQRLLQIRIKANSIVGFSGFIRDYGSWSQYFDSKGSQDNKVFEFHPNFYVALVGPFRSSNQLTICFVIYLFIHSRVHEFSDINCLVIGNL